MINNSSLQKWDRLNHKGLDQQFLNEIMTGMECSPFEAAAILDTVYRVYRPYFETSGTLRPGQILFQVMSINTGSQTPLAQGEQITVTLTLEGGEEDLKIRREQGVIGLRRHRIQRVCHEAFQQGGLLTVEDLANPATAGRRENPIKRSRSVQAAEHSAAPEVNYQGHGTGHHQSIHHR